MRPIYSWSIAVGILIGLSAGAVTYQKEIENSFPKPNILILSLCSLRTAEMASLFGKGESITPNIDSAFQSGVALSNVYSSFGWANLSFYMLKQFDEKYLTENGYDVISDNVRPLTLSVRSDSQQGEPEQAVNEVKPKLDYLKNRLSLFRSRPFFAFLNVKYMHYPYIDEVNANPQWDKYLSAEEKKHVSEVLGSRHLLKDRLPFALTLSGKTDLVDHFPEFRADSANPVAAFYGLYNLMVDGSALRQWAQSSDHAKELSILRKVYRAKLNTLDGVLADTLNLFGRKDLLDNTIVVLMGDHGEAFMEHGQLGHAMQVYDENLTLPFYARFPRSWRGSLKAIRDQVHMGSLADWLRHVIAGDNKEPGFIKHVVNNPKNKYILSRNCANNIHSVRFDNRWKFIVDRVNREKMLFDLKADPAETNNLYEAEAETAAELELYLSTHLNDLDAIVDPTACSKFAL